ncbi:hypothetical protein DMN77_23250 [Paenibacillus sp. 79R4]|nr:hypothetical protein [Paenibacillus sp. 79R4]
MAKLVLNNEIGSISIIKVLEFDSEKEESIFQVYTEYRDLMKDGSIPIANGSMMIMYVYPFLTEIYHRRLYYGAMNVHLRVLIMQYFH